MTINITRADQLAETLNSEVADAIEVTTVKRAVLYLRVSTSKQATRNGGAEGYSIPA